MVQARRLLALLFVGAVAFALTACEADDGPDEEVDVTDVDDDDEDGEARHGGQLRVALSSDPGLLNPAATTSGAVHFATHLMFNGLVDLDENLEPVPELAEDWDIEDDGALYRFHLRDDVTWHDGEPFTSEDVRFSFEEVLLDLHSRTAASVGGALDRIETPDDHTVEFYFDEPYAPLLQQLDVGEAAIVPRHVFEGADSIEEHPGSTQDPVGTGPFQFVSYEPDSEIILERNPNYFEDDLPYLDTVIMRIIPEDASQVAALEAGEIDYLSRVPNADRDRLEEQAGIEILETFRGAGAVNCPMTMTFNLDRPTLQDVDVRRGIAFALDQQAFVDQVLFGHGLVPVAPLHSGMEWAHTGDMDLPGYDLEQAEELLAEAGWVLEDGEDVRVAQGVDGVDDGTPFEITFVAFPTFSEYGELLRSQLGEAGIDVTVVALEPPAFVERVFTERDFDTNIISFCQGPDPEVGVRRQIASDQIGDTPFSNAAGYENERVDELLDEGLRTVDIDERVEVYRELQEILVEDLPYYWVTEPIFSVAHTDRCQGFVPFNQYAEAAFCDEE